MRRWTAARALNAASKHLVARQTGSYRVCPFDVNFKVAAPHSLACDLHGRCAPRGADGCGARAVTVSSLQVHAHAAFRATTGRCSRARWVTGVVVMGAARYVLPLRVVTRSSALSVIDAHVATLRTYSIVLPFTPVAGRCGRQDRTHGTRTRGRSAPQVYIQHAYRSMHHPQHNSTAARAPLTATGTG